MEEGKVRPPLFMFDPQTGQVGEVLTKRDYFAAAALTGICANRTFTKLERVGVPSHLANWAVAVADATVAALEKRRDETQPFRSMTITEGAGCSEHMHIVIYPGGNCRCGVIRGGAHQTAK